MHVSGRFEGRTVVVTGGSRGMGARHARGFVSGGAIVNISSVAGLIGTPLSGAYTTSKFALRGLTKVAALELGRDNIRVNSIHPGYVRTPAITMAGLTPERVGVQSKLTLPRMAE